MHERDSNDHGTEAPGRTKRPLGVRQSPAWDAMWLPSTLPHKHAQPANKDIADEPTSAQDQAASHSRSHSSLHTRDDSSATRSSSRCSSRSRSSAPSDASIRQEQFGFSPLPLHSQSFGSHLDLTAPASDEERESEADGASSCGTGVALWADLTLDAQAQMHNHNSWTPFVNRRRKQMQRQQQQTDAQIGALSGGSRMDLSAVTPRRHPTVHSLLPVPSPTLPSCVSTPHAARAGGGSTGFDEFDDDLECACTEDSPDFPFALPTEEECEAFFRNRPRSPPRSPRKPIKLYDAETDTVVVHEEAIASVTQRWQPQHDVNEYGSFDFGSPICERPASHAFDTPAPFAAPCSPLHGAAPSSPINLPADALFALTPAPLHRLPQSAGRLAAPSFGSALKTLRSAPLWRPVDASVLTPAETQRKAAAIETPSPFAGLALSPIQLSKQQQPVPQVPAPLLSAAPLSTKRLVRFDVPASHSSSINSSSLSHVSSDSSLASFDGGFVLQSVQELSQFDCTALHIPARAAAATPDAAFRFEQNGPFNAGSKDRSLHNSVADHSLMRSLVPLDSLQVSHSSSHSTSTSLTAAPTAFHIVVDSPVSAAPSGPLALDRFSDASSFHSSSSSSADDLSFGADATSVQRPSTAAATPAFLRVPGRQRGCVASAPVGSHRVPIKRQHTQPARAARFSGARFHRKQRMASTGAKVRSLRIFPSHTHSAGAPSAPQLPSPVAVNRTLDFSSIDADANETDPQMRPVSSSAPRPAPSFVAGSPVRASPSRPSCWLPATADRDSSRGTNLSDTFEQIASAAHWHGTHTSKDATRETHTRRKLSAAVSAAAPAASASVCAPSSSSSFVRPAISLSCGLMLPSDLASVYACHVHDAAAAAGGHKTCDTASAQPAHTAQPQPRPPLVAAASAVPSCCRCRGVSRVCVRPSSSSGVFVPLSRCCPVSAGLSSVSCPCPCAGDCPHPSSSSAFAPVQLQLYYRVEEDTSQARSQEQFEAAVDAPAQQRTRRTTHAQAQFGQQTRSPWAAFASPSAARWSPLSASPYPSPSLAAAKQRFCAALAAY